MFITHLPSLLHTSAYRKFRRSHLPNYQRSNPSMETHHDHRD